MSLLAIILQPLHLLIGVLIWSIILSSLFMLVDANRANPIVSLINQIAHYVLKPLYPYSHYFRIGAIDLTPLVAIVLLQLFEGLLWSIA